MERLRYFQIIFDLTIFAGLPATTQFAGTSFVTIAPAATTAPLPIVTPFSIIAFVPIQTCAPMVIGLDVGEPTISCESQSRITTPGAIAHPCPIRMLFSQTIEAFSLIYPPSSVRFPPPMNMDTCTFK